ncbi:MAG: MarR family winged helix-turn-helix transcriptional regulator [Vicinamibacterales bacterium]
MARSTPVKGRRPRAARIPLREDVLGFMRVMWAVDHALQRASKHMNQSSGLTGPQRLVVRLLGRTPGISAGELAAELHLDPSTLTGILQRLENRRLVQRQRDPADARRLRLSLTSKGEACDTPEPGTIESAVSRAMRGRAPREVNAASGLLTSIAAELGVAPSSNNHAPKQRARKGR